MTNQPSKGRQGCRRQADPGEAADVCGERGERPGHARRPAHAAAADGQGRVAHLLRRLRAQERPVPVQQEEVAEEARGYVQVHNAYL